MDEKKEANSIDTLLLKAEDYGKTTLALLKLKAIRIATDTLSNIVANAMVLFMLSIFLFMANLGLAIWIGEILGHIYLGFFTLACFYGLLALIVFLMRKTIVKRSVSNSLISQFLEN